MKNQVKNMIKTITNDIDTLVTMLTHTSGSRSDISFLLHIINTGGECIRLKDPFYTKCNCPLNCSYYAVFDPLRVEQAKEALRRLKKV